MGLDRSVGRSVGMESSGADAPGPSELGGAEHQTSLSRGREGRGC